MKFELKHLMMLSVLTLILLPHRTYSQGMPTSQVLTQKLSNEKNFTSLVSTNRDKRLNAAMELDAQRKLFIEKLLTILESTNSDEVKLDVVVVLGEYRASEAIPILIRHLEWDEISSGGFTLGHISREELAEWTGPVAGALEKIGMPAIPALQNKIMQTDDVKITSKCVSICQVIEGPQVTQFRLQGLLDKESDLKKKERIQSALDVLKNLKTVK